MRAVKQKTDSADFDIKRFINCTWTGRANTVLPLPNVSIFIPTLLLYRLCCRTYYNVAGAIPALRNKVVIFHQNISILIERTKIFAHKSGVLRTATSNQTSVKL